MHLIPSAVAPITAIADKKDSTRFSLGAVLLDLKDGGNFRVTATDAKVLLMVEGQGLDAAEWPVGEQMAAAPNSGTRAIIPAGRFAQLMDTGKRMGRIAGRHKAMFRSVAVKIAEPPPQSDQGPAVAVEATDMAARQFETFEGAVGRFPPVDEIIPKDGTVDFTVRLCPVLLGKLLKTMKDLGATGVDFGFQYKAPNRSVRVAAVSEDQQLKMTGCIMPLGG